MGSEAQDIGFTAHGLRQLSICERQG